MTQYLELTRRNMRIYLRDKGAVFFSLLTMLIVLGLMMFFLGDMNVQSLTDALAQLPNRDAVADEANASLYVLLWTCGGIVSINAVTVTMAVYSSMVRDRANGRLNSIYTAPISRMTVAAASVTSAWVCSVIICVLTLAISEIYSIIQGGAAFSLTAHLQLLGMIMANSFTYASLMYLAAVLIKTEGAWSSVDTVIGTLVGFLGGIYIPIGGLGDGIAAVLKCTPVLYGAKMFRSVMTADIGNTIFENAPAELKTEYLEVMGVELDFFGNQVSDTSCVVILLASGLLFLLLGALLTRRNTAK